MYLPDEVIAKMTIEELRRFAMICTDLDTRRSDLTMAQDELVTSWETTYRALKFVEKCRHELENINGHAGEFTYNMLVKYDNAKPIFEPTDFDGSHLDVMEDLG